MTFSGNLPSEDEIVSLCQPISQEHRTEGIRYGKDIWVKFGRYLSNLTAEVRAQIYAFRHADRSTVSVPEVYHLFQRDDRMYILMEYIEGESLRQYLKDNPSQPERWDDAVSNAIRSVWKFPIPDDAKPGSLGEVMPTGSLWGEFFSTDYVFQNKKDLENWINGMLQKNGRPETERVNFGSGRLAQQGFIQFLLMRLGSIRGEIGTSESDGSCSLRQLLIFVVWVGFDTLIL